MQVYITGIGPLPEFASPVWDPCQANQIKKIEAVQRKAARFVKSNYDYQSSVNNTLKELGWPTLQQRRYVARTCLFHKEINK